MKILVVIGARPQFIKHAPFEFIARNFFEIVTIHTGQHYDENMSKVFFDQLKINKPNYLLNTGGGNHGEQTGKMLQEIEPIVIKENPQYILVYGDTNSTLAGALVGAKLHIPIIHVEAGLRSFNKSMPEEINRILTDHMSKLLFTSTENGINNLKNEGITSNVYLVGDVMTDAVFLAEKINGEELTARESLEDYYYVTIHRPYNTDNQERITKILNVLNSLDKQVIFPIHPRTKNLCESFGIDMNSFLNISFIEPTSYFDNIRYLKNAQHAVTDSGGLQKEAYILKTPCITVRSETEWTETLIGNWNTLCFDDVNEIPNLIGRTIGHYQEGLYGEGSAAEQICQIIQNHDENK